MAIAAGSAQDGWSERRQPATIGAYRIVRELGEGGMGIVYLAAQTHPIRRLVALKVIKVGMDTRDVVVRWETSGKVFGLDPIFGRSTVPNGTCGRHE